MMSSRPAGVRGLSEREVNGLVDSEVVTGVFGEEGTASTDCKGGDLIRIGSIVAGRRVSNAALG
jgi:hypothetical protein